MDLEQFNELLGKKISESLDPVVKGFEDRFAKLEEPVPQAIHTQNEVIDDGSLQQVNTDEYRLPGGSVISTSRMWQATGKGFHRRNGAFVKLGEEADGFFRKMMEDLRTKEVFQASFVEKALDIGDTIRAADDSSAGLFVPEDVRYALLQFAPPGTIVWPRAQVWPMTTDNIQWPKLVQDLTTDAEDFFGNVVLTWTEEGASKTKTKPEFTSLKLNAHELSAYSEVTDQLLEDSAINIGNLLVQLFQGAYWHKTDKAFLTAYGQGTPLGILNDPNVNSVDRVTSSRVQFQDLLNMSSELPPMFDAGAVWFMAKEVFNNLRKQTDNQGQPVIQLGEGYNNFGEGIAGFILGYPVVMSDYKTAALGSTGDVVLGDWKHYFVGERKTISVEMSRHAAFQHNRTAFRAKSRLGGIPEEPKAFVVLNATADPNMS
jgi:HK97 family phage major capsid protein